MQQLAGDLFHLVDGFHHVHRNADGSRLIGDGAGNGLADPPGCIGGKLKALGVVELLHRFNQAKVALLNQVQELHAAAHIPLGNADHQAQVRLAQPLAGKGVAVCHAGGKLNLLLGGEQRHPANFLEVDLNRVVNANAFG